MTTNKGHHSAGNSGELPGSAVGSDLRSSDLEQLLVLAARGDAAAFRRLYDATSGKLFAQAIAILRDRSAAEDALQDAFIRVWERAGCFDPGRGPALPWLVTLVRNAAIDRLRRDRLQARCVDYDDHLRESPMPPVPVDDRIDLLDALGRLSGDQRRAVTTVILAGWTNEQAALKDGTPTPTMKARVARGLSRMRAHLDPASELAVALGGRTKLY